jgi:hypothetical protein
MTKKHFIALADTLVLCRPTTDSETFGTFIVPGHHGDGQIHQWNLMRDRLADFCASQNPQFNRERWLAYIARECGPNG